STGERELRRKPGLLRLSLPLVSFGLWDTGGQKRRARLPNRVGPAKVYARRETFKSLIEAYRRGATSRLNKWAAPTEAREAPAASAIGFGNRSGPRPLPSVRRGSSWPRCRDPKGCGVPFPVRNPSARPGVLSSSRTNVVGAESLRGAGPACRGERSTASTPCRRSSSRRPRMRDPQGACSVRRTVGWLRWYSDPPRIGFSQGRTAESDVLGRAWARGHPSATSATAEPQ